MNRFSSLPEASPVLELANRIENDRSLWIALFEEMKASGDWRKEMRFENGFLVSFMMEERGSKIVVCDAQGNEALVMFPEISRDSEVGELEFDQFLEGFMVFLQLRLIMVLSDLNSVVTHGKYMALLQGKEMVVEFLGERVVLGPDEFVDEIAIPHV